MKNLSLIIFIIVLIILTPRAYAAENSAGPSADLSKPVIANGADTRAKILKEYLEQYKSPLAPFAVIFVEIADKYNLDWRLVTAISGVESTFGREIPYDSFNGWGWGVYGNNVIRFSSWKEGIETVSKGLRENYIDKGAYGIYQIGVIYAESPNWASKVNYFMKKIDEFKSQNEIDNLPISL